MDKNLCNKVVIQNKMKKPQYNPKYTTTMNMKSAFEQGKAEERIRIIEIINEMERLSNINGENGSYKELKAKLHEITE